MKVSSPTSGILAWGSNLEGQKDLTIVNQVQEAQSPRQNKPKQERTKTHSKIKLAKIKDKGKILKSNKGKTNNMQGNSHQVIS